MSAGMSLLLLIGMTSAQAQSAIPGGQCCFSTTKWPYESTPEGGCLKEITCKEATQGLFVRCYQEKTNDALRIQIDGEKKRPEKKFCSQQWLIGDKLAEGKACVKYDYTSDEYYTNAEFVAGPDTRFGKDIDIWCSGKHESPVLRKMREATYVFQTAMYRTEPSGRVIETIRNGQIMREPEILTYEAPLTEGRILIKR
jgi:hypothetical protein